MGRVFVDTNVLFPFSVVDLLLALSEDAIHTCGSSCDAHSGSS